MASLALREAVDPAPAVYLLALLGSLASVTILQNFALNIGGTNIANLAAVRDQYRLRMVAEESERQARWEQARSLLVQRRLSSLPIDVLRTELRRMYLLGGFEPDRANAQLAALEAAAAGDDVLLATIFASSIATINPDYAARLPEMLRSEQGGQSAAEERGARDAAG